MKRIFGLDFMRALAIVWVMYVHYAYILYPLFPYKYELFFNFFNWFGGYFSVDLFFVLSGFLIGSIFVEEFINGEVNNVGKQIKDFWVKRWFRTLPNYYLFLVLNLVIYFLIEGKNYLYLVPKYALFLQKIKSTDQLSIFGVSWSLAIEEWFYLFLPSIYFVLYKLTNNRKLSFLVPLSLMFIVPVIAKCIYVFTHPFYANHSEFFKFTTFTRLDPIGYGVMFAFLWHTGKKSYFIKYKKKFAVIGIGIFVLTLAYSYAFLAKAIQHSIAYSLISSISSISIFFFFTYIHEMKNFRNSFINKSIELISKLSYSLYISHILVLDLFEYFSKGSSLFESSAGRITKLFMIYSITIAVSFFIYEKFEKPFLKIRYKYIT